MKAAFFHDHIFARDTAGQYYSNGGLPYQVLQRYVRHFDALKVVGRVQPGTAGSPGARASLASGPGVEFDCLERASRTDLLWGRGVARHVRETLSTVDCAIVRLPSMLGLQACREASRMGRPWLAEVVGCVWQGLWYHGSASGKVLAPPLFLATRRWIARAPFVIYVSERFLQRRYPTTGRSVACSNVAIGPPDPAVLTRRLDRIAATPRPRPLRLGLVGTLDTNFKGHDTALRALARLTRSGLDASLHFLGVGATARWETLATRLGVREKVAFDGLLPAGPAVLAWMDALDVLLAPSLADGLPRSLVEAMSRAIPVVGADTGGIPELVEPSLIHRPGDADALCRLVETLVESPARRAEVASRNFTRARSFTADVLEARRSGQLEAFKAWAAGRLRP